MDAARCCLHAERSAAAVCKGCSRAFCRECVTEHDYRFLCKSCLEASASTAGRRAPVWVWLGRPAAAFGAFLIAYLTFYAAGKIVSLIPPEYHLGKLE